MSSVTHRIREVKQPRGGYVPPKEFVGKTLSDGVELKLNENVHASIIGMAVDYLTRFMMGASLEEAFAISLLGASLVNETGSARKLLQGIKGLDDKSIVNACKLSGYDICVRAGTGGYKPGITTEPNADSIFNIRTMVSRSVEFWKEYGPVIKSGFTFEGGYTNVITSGDGDYITKDTLWDFKVSKDAPKIQHTLQLLVYYLMGCRSSNREFRNIKYLGIFNPRLNNVYLLGVTQISPAIIDEVSEVVIGYSNSKSITENDVKKGTNSKETIESDDWSLNDLVSRYGVSRSKITGDFLRMGLPYYKVGRAYHFSKDDVIEWEIDQKYIPYGKNKRIPLPAFIEYKIYLEREIKKAKKAGDKERVQALKQEAKSRQISIRNGALNAVLNIGLVVAVLVLIMIVLKTIGLF